MLRIGAHLSKGKNLSEPIHKIIEAGGNALQIFLSPPVNANCGTILKPDEVNLALQMCEQNNFYLVIHGKYILNFARPRDASSEWQFECLKNDLREADKIKADVIIHQGKNLAHLKLSETEAENTFAQNINTILAETSQLNNRIILENSCHQGTEMGYKIEQLAQIFKAIDAQYRHRIGFCLDLCHIHVAGTCDMRSLSAVESLFETFDQLIGLAYLKVVHFNDSKIDFGGCNDHHDDLLLGQIGNPLLGGSSEGFKAVVKKCHKLGIPMILETPRKESSATSQQIKMLRAWANDDHEFEQTFLATKQNKETKIKIPRPVIKMKPKV